MSDRSPPKKKSRFFESGKSKIGNFLHRKKKTRKDEDNSAEPDPDDRGESEDGPPLLANIQPVSPFSQPLTSTQRQSPQPLSAPSTQTLSNPAPLSFQRDLSTGRLVPSSGQSQVSTPAPALPAQDADSEAETERESGSDSEEEQEYKSSDEENIKPAKDPRRQGIYGAQALLPTGSNVQRQVTNNPVFLPPPYPLIGGPSTNVNPALAPVGNNHIFSGVPSHPFVTAAGGQFPFNFQPVPGLPIPTTIQQPIYNLYQHPVGSGLARMAQESAHADNGPLGQPPAPPPTKSARPAAPGKPSTSYVDMDRDAHGQPIPKFNSRPPAHHGIRPGSERAPSGNPNPDSLVPENMYTSPQRIERAHQFAQISLKRKRLDTILPPQSYVYQHTGAPNFNIFNGILLYPELCFALAAHLPVKDLLSLYAISKDFHVIMDTRFTTVMLAQATRKAPESTRTFMFRSYARLCRVDPAARIPHPNADAALQGKIRLIPSFRWLKMVLHREKVIHELITVFAEDGIPLPARCSLALKRLWFILDIPDNARRIGFTHNTRCMTNMDLYFCACFFVKLDMRLNDPVSGEKRDGVRKILLAQRSFTTILRVLKREMWTTRFDMLKEWVRLKYEHPANVTDEQRGLNIFGVKSHLVGRGHLEYWGTKTAAEAGHKIHPLMRPDQLIIREAFRRGMRFDKHYLRFLLYGYIRPDTLENYAPRPHGRRIEGIKNDEYEVDDVVGGVAALGWGDEGFDELLDLGHTRETSRFTVMRECTGRGERELREREEEFLSRCMEWWTFEGQMEMEAEEQERVWFGMSKEDD